MTQLLIQSKSQTSYTWQTVLNGILEHKQSLAAGNAIAILAVTTSVPIPMLMPFLVDEVLLDEPGFLVSTMNDMFPAAWHGPILYIIAILLVTMCLRVSSVILNVWQTKRFTYIAKEVTYRMRRDLLHRLQFISMAEYETLGSGAVASRFVTDINTIDDFVGQSVSKFLVAVLSLAGVAAVLLWLQWQLALFILFLNPVVVYFTTVLGKRVKTLKQSENQAFEVFQQALTDTLGAIREVRASNRERHYIQELVGRARGVKNHSASFSWKSDAANRASFGIFLIGFDIFRAISMLMVVFSGLTIGHMLAVFAYLWFMMGPVQELLNIQYAYFAARAALTRVNGVLELGLEPRHPHIHDPFHGRETVAVRLEDISFSYVDEPVLRNVSLSIAAGEKVALVGASGGGKSTLVQVVLGMYPPQSGHLYFDDIPVEEIGLDVVRDNVATVLQHPAMINGSVRVNLTFGREFSEEKLWQVLEIAQLRDIVEDLPKGLDTIIGNDGIRLSGGQQQRLAIARMTLTDPKVVILDEATSALDNETEARLHAALSEHLKNRTTLIIAHRLSAVKQANRVYVFEDGHIIEQGSHDELINSNGLYNKLYARARPA